jgi:nucleotide-binding universal stress UspA family protein
MEAVRSKSAIAFKNILLATDEPAHAETLVAWAAAFARHFESQLMLVHVVPKAERAVVPPGPYSMPSPEPPLPDMRKKEAEQALATLARSPHLLGIEPITMLPEGTPDAVLPQLIRVSAADLVVLGTHGRKGIRRAVLGSVAETILRSAPCPVLTVPPSCRPVKPIRCILYAMDFSTEARAAMPFALGLADEHDARLVLVHVDRRNGNSYSYNHAVAANKFSAMLRDEVPRGWRRRVEVAVEFAPPAEGILNAAAKEHADLIIMGVRGLGFVPGLATHFVGGTAHKVLVDATCPVFTVRP